MQPWEVRDAERELTVLRGNIQANVAFSLFLTILLIIYGVYWYDTLVIFLAFVAFLPMSMLAFGGPSQRSRCVSYNHYNQFETFPPDQPYPERVHRLPPRYYDF